MRQKENCKNAFFPRDVGKPRRADIHMDRISTRSREGAPSLTCSVFAYLDYNIGNTDKNNALAHTHILRLPYK